MIAVALVGVVLQGGQIRYFPPGRLAGGESVRCMVGKQTTTAAVPYAPTSIDEYSLGGPRLEIGRRPNGAVRLACDAKPSLPPKITKPYVIGQNGLDLIAGANRLSRLERIYGAPSSTGSCSAAWQAIGLTVTFVAPACNVLASARVTDRRWSSISGAHVGDDVGKMAWFAEGAKPVAGALNWQLATGRQYSSELVATIGPKRTVVALTATLHRPPG